MTNQNHGAGDGRKNCFIYIICSMFKKKNSLEKMQLNEQEIRNKMAAAAAEANDECPKKAENPPVIKHSKKHCKRRGCTTKRHRDRCNSKTNPLLRYFRLWCPCFCCCKTRNKATICCEHCPYKEKRGEPHHAKKCGPDELNGQQKKVHEKPKKKTAKSTYPKSKPNANVQNTAATANALCTSTEPQNEPNNETKYRNSNDCNEPNDNNNNNMSQGNDNTTCCQRIPEIYTKKIKCKCAKRIVSLELHRPEMIKRQIKNGIQFIRKCR